MEEEPYKLVRSKSTPGLVYLEAQKKNEGLSKKKRNDSFNNLRENLEALANAAGLQHLPTPPPKVVSIWKAFKDFAFQGSVIDLAVGIIVGGAFGKIVNSLVNDIIMPPIGWLLSGVDFANIYFLLKRGKKAKLTHGTYKSLNHAKEDGAVTVNVGVFLNSVLNFVVISIIIFTFVRTITQSKKEHVKSTKKCRYCFNKIDVRATRCPCCTAVLEVPLITVDDQGHQQQQPLNDDGISSPDQQQQQQNSHYLQKSASSSSSYGRPRSLSVEEVKETSFVESDDDDDPKSRLRSSNGLKKKEGKNKETAKVLKKNLKRQLTKIDFTTW